MICGYTFLKQQECSQDKEQSSPSRPDLESKRHTCEVENVLQRAEWNSAKAERPVTATLYASQIRQPAATTARYPVDYIVA